MSDLPDDDTIRVRRSWAGAPPVPDDAEGDLDEVTAVSRRRGAGRVPPGSAAPASPHTSPATTDPGIGPRRSTYIDGPLDTEQVVGEPGDGSTIVARRESRRRAAREPSPDDAPAAPTASAPPTQHSTGEQAVAGRTAHSPAHSSETYGVRRSGPAMAVHRDAGNEAPERSRQTPVDAAAVDARRRRGERRATIIVVGTASAIVVAAASALIAIVLSL